MKTDSEQERKLADARLGLRRTWLLWGVGLLAICALLVLATSASHASEAQTSQRQAERKFEAALAVSALLFFVGFSMDGRWTDAERLGKRIYKATGDQSFSPSPSQLAAGAELAFASIHRSVSILTAIGLLMGLIALVAVASGLALAYGLQLLVLAATYQLFVFSRHPYYDEVLEAALDGKLPVPQDHKNNHA